jgi:SAM-dependent methyltransferase
LAPVRGDLTIANWGHCAVTASSYAIAWQAEHTPPHIALACAMAGIDWQPRPSMTVADLGCGRGYNANLLAAANPGWTVLGLDHDPSGIAEARQLAAQAGLSNSRFAEADLAGMSLAEIDSLPPLDIAIIHGVWSWVSDEVRAGIVRLLARRLKPGGVAYLGYNALPASGADMALQRLLRQLAGPFGTGAGEAAAAAARLAMATWPSGIVATTLYADRCSLGLRLPAVHHLQPTGSWGASTPNSAHPSQ